LRTTASSIEQKAAVPVLPTEIGYAVAAYCPAEVVIEKWYPLLPFPPLSVARVLSIRQAVVEVGAQGTADPPRLDNTE
jgi:hypothetical protein